jgi:hypothetical protein
VQEGELSGGSRLFLIILTLLMMKCHDQNEAFRNYQKFKIIFEYTAPNGAFKIIDYSRPSIKTNAPFLTLFGVGSTFESIFDDTGLLTESKTHLNFEVTVTGNSNNHR